jgi:tetratricopeptide (TPR) repeat protein
MRKFLINIIISFVIFNSAAVITEARLQGQLLVDSLLKELPRIKSDTNSILYLNKLSYSLNNINPNLGIKYGFQGIELNKSLKWVVGDGLLFNSIGLNYFNKRDLANSFSYFNKSLTINKKNGFKQFEAENLGNLGLVYAERKEYSKALEYANKSLKINEEINYIRGIALSNFVLGKIYNNTDLPIALDYFLKSLKIYETIDDKLYQSILLTDISNIFSNIKNFDKSKEYLIKAMKFQEELGLKSELPGQLNSLGIINFSAGDINSAIDNFKKAIEINIELDNIYANGSNYINVGVMFYNLNDFDKSIDYHLKSLEIFEKFKDSANMVGVMGNIADIFQEIKFQTKRRH